MKRSFWRKKVRTFSEVMIEMDEAKTSDAVLKAAQYIKDNIWHYSQNEYAFAMEHMACRYYDLSLEALAGAEKLLEKYGLTYYKNLKL